MLDTSAGTHTLGRGGLISPETREGSSKLMLCDVQLLAQICCGHLFCLASLKCSHSDTKEDVCSNLLTDRFPQPFSDSPGILQLSEVNSRQKHFPLDLSANKNVVTHRSWMDQWLGAAWSKFDKCCFAFSKGHVCVLQSESPFLLYCELTLLKRHMGPPANHIDS